MEDQDSNDDDSLRFGDSAFFGLQRSEAMERIGLEQLAAAVEMIPDEEKAAYEEARMRCIEVFEEESDPIRFLRAENFNPWAAASRITRYWKFRKEIFGEMAFLPMNLTGEGALRKEDMALFNNPLCAILPNDKIGRSCVLFDRSQSAVCNVRALFLLGQILSENEMSQTVGHRVIYLVNNLGGTKYNRQVAKKVSEVFRLGMPMKPGQYHFISITPPKRRRYFLENILPLAINKLGKYISSTAVFDFADSKADAAAKLENAGFRKQGLPPCVGGTLESAFVDWQLQRGRIAAEVQDLSILVHSALENYSKRISASQKCSAKHGGAFYQEDEEEMGRAKKRKVDAVNARRKRARAKIEIEVLMKQCWELKTKNAGLRMDNAKMENMLRTANSKLLESKPKVR